MAMLALAIILAAAGCKPGGGDRLEPVGEARVDIEHKACLKAGGDYLRLGTGNIFYCQTIPGDAGKSCARASDCESACLARSRTCAPVKPLLGCEDVLLEGGTTARQCIE
jgi:hypothetical protein